MTTLRQFEYFATVVDADSFTAAAAELHVSQPGLSHQIKALERTLGGQLLERLPRGVRLTPLGRAVLPHARATLADAQRARGAAVLALGGRAGAIDVATITSISLGVLPGVLRAWRREHPEVTVRLHEYRQVDDLEDAMRAGEDDVAVSPLPAGWDGPAWEVGVEEFVIVVGPEHPMARENRCSAPVDAFAAETWVHFAPEHGLAGVLDHVAALNGFTPLVAMRVEQTAAAPLYAAAGVGPALVPANIVAPAFAGHLVRPDPPIRRTVHAFARTSADALTRTFVESVLSTADLVPAHVRERCGAGTSDLGKY